MGNIFKSCDILLPDGQDMEKWAVVACDQFSSQKEYWQALDEQIGDAPSTLRLMLPEAYLEMRDQFEQAKIINETMRSYLDSGVFKTLEDSYIYVERTLRDGTLRRGIVGALNLDEYDYAQGSTSPVRATEGTIEDRLPPRVRIRKGAALEMPHIMVFVDDKDNSLMSGLTLDRQKLEKVYDFNLSGGGGSIKGYAVSGENKSMVEDGLMRLADPETIGERYGNLAPVIYAMGDGNHSLATAKKCWLQLRETLSDNERENHPARYSLVEIVNIHDEAITFEPIHKVIFETNPDSFISDAIAFWAKQSKDGAEHSLRLVTDGREEVVSVTGLMIGELIAKAEIFCQNHMAAHGGRIDYIHNDEAALEMGRRSGAAAILMPTLGKDELFPSIIKSGPFPKKSFSIGHAEDKRYYLECRKIK